MRLGFNSPLIDLEFESSSITKYEIFDQVLLFSEYDDYSDYYIDFE